MKVIYSPKQNATFERAIGFSSPSAGKPERVIEDWKKNRIPLEIMPPNPLTPDQIALAHDSEFVQLMLQAKICNGFGNKSRDVAASIPYTNGAMYDAAKTAFMTRESVCAPVSGFHHAGWNSAEGFCTFNGLMIAAISLVTIDDVQRVAIIDCDEHYGNGTVDILERVSPEIRSRIHHFTSGEYFGDDPEEAEQFFDKLRVELEKSEDCSVVIYQAGADQHIDDPLGGFLTTEQLSMRDWIVFDWSRKTGIPVAWDLAGGYQESEDGDIAPVLEIHRNTALACIG